MSIWKNRWKNEYQKKTGKLSLLSYVCGVVFMLQQRDHLNLLLFSLILCNYRLKNKLCKEKFSTEAHSLSKAADELIRTTQTNQDEIKQLQEKVRVQLKPRLGRMWFYDDKKYMC